MSDWEALKRWTTAFDEETAEAESIRCLQCDLRMNITRSKFWATIYRSKPLSIWNAFFFYSAGSYSVWLVCYNLK